MKHPPATRQDHLRFCEIEGWEKVRSSRGKAGTHHDTFEFSLPNGEVLRTRISRPPDRTDYGASLWKHILKDQLSVSESEFWDCVESKKPPKRDAVPEADTKALPTDVVWALLNRIGLTEAEVGTMTKKEAIDRLTRFWATGE